MLTIRGILRSMKLTKKAEPAPQPDPEPQWDATQECFWCHGSGEFLAESTWPCCLRTKAAWIEWQRAQVSY